jgi:hypothetical protein
MFPPESKTKLPRKPVGPAGQLADKLSDLSQSMIGTRSINGSRYVPFTE